jgi:ethanolamine ammonia-lyase small subunit
LSASEGPASEPGPAHGSAPAPAPASGSATASAQALVEPDTWAALRALTPARIALGRVGASQPTGAQLAFSLAHAQARDAVHEPLDVVGLDAGLTAAGFEVLHAHSRAADRAQYLRRPDLGRRLDDASVSRLRSAARTPAPELVFVVADGLSALAVARHAVPMLEAARARLPGWSIGPVVVAGQARVALGDEAGELLGARAVALLVGERPGLSSPDSLGIYLTWAPRVGRTDAERNCISNIRPEGLSYARAAITLAGLLEGARRLGATGVSLKDESGDTPALPASNAG